MNTASTFTAIALAASVSLTQAQPASPAPGTPPPAPIYLRCDVALDPPGLNDLHIDFAKKIVTDSFGTSHPYREDGPFIISETFVVIEGKSQVATTKRVNRYTLTLEYMWPAQQISKKGQCSVVEKRL